MSGKATDEGSAEFFEAIQRGLGESYRDVVQPAMDTAEALTDAGGIDAVEPGVQAFLAWERELQLLNLDILRAEREALSQQMERIMDKLRLNMRDRCFNQHDLSMAARLMGLAREFALLRGDAVAAQALEDARKCLTFELDFEFVLTTRVDTLTWESHVRARGVQVSLGFGAIVPVAQPLELLSYTVTSSICGVSTGAHVTKPFRVNAGRLNVRYGKLEGASIPPDSRPTNASPAGASTGNPSGRVRGCRTVALAAGSALVAPSPPTGF